MAENTLIEWADHTFNPWIGCTKVSPGCDHCYAERREDLRLHRVQWGPGQPRQRTKTWRDPVKWNDAHAAFFAQHGRRQRVFCASLADVFDNEVDPAWRDELLGLIATTPNLDWLLLTKRIGNVSQMVKAEAWAHLPHVWLGATVVNQAEVDRDVPKLLAVPARVRFLSIEPMLGPIDLKADARATGRHVNWVIAGGESGPGARPMHPDWVRDLRDQCARAGVPFLFKQWGEWTMQAYAVSQGMPATVAVAHDGSTLPMGQARARIDVGQRFHCMYRVGKKHAGRLLDGREHNGFPA